MKDNKTKRAFIEARAEGKSYDTISKELKISKSTCTEWNNELKGEIATLKDAQTEELYTTYKMQRDARIKAIGGILNKLDTAIDKIDYTELSPRDLLSLRLQYARALKEEYIEPLEVEQDYTVQGIIAQQDILYSKVLTGELTPAGAKAGLEVLKAKQGTVKEYADLAEEASNPLDIRLSNINRKDVLLWGETIEAWIEEQLAKREA